MAQHMEVSKVEKRKRDSEETPRFKHNLKPEESDSADEVQSIKFETKGDRLFSEGEVVSVEEFGMAIADFPDQVDLNQFSEDEE